MATNQPTTVGPIVDLNKFRRDCLVVATGMTEPSGLDILDELEQHYQKEVAHGQLYPALGALETKGLIRKEAIDGRTNAYLVTERGRRELAAHRDWIDEQLEANQ